MHQSSTRLLLTVFVAYVPEHWNRVTGHAGPGQGRIFVGFRRNPSHIVSLCKNAVYNATLTNLFCFPHECNPCSINCRISPASEDFVPVDRYRDNAAGPCWDFRPQTPWRTRPSQILDLPLGWVGWSVHWSVWRPTVNVNTNFYSALVAIAPNRPRWYICWREQIIEIKRL